MPSRIRRDQLKLLLAYLPAFACLAMLLIVCLPMLLKRHEPGQDDEVAELRNEVAQLRAKIAGRDEAKVDG